ncbi:MAG: MOSC domain-containing protein [Acidobacteriota bacterium]
MPGQVVHIHVAAAGGGPMTARSAVRAVAGSGLEGDRHFREDGQDRPDRQVTLIEQEAVEALGRDYGLALSPGESRRNITTRGIALNHLVGRTFRVGQALFQGVMLCEPCGHLQRMTKKKVIKGLVHRGGLRARIVEDGLVKVGDPIAETP